MDTRRAPLLAVLAAALLGLPGCTARGDSTGDALEQEYPKTYAEIEMKRRDIRPIHERTKAAMDVAMGEGAPDGGVSTLISLNKQRYLRDEPVELTILWVNNTERPVRVCRRLLLDANFRPLIFHDDLVQVLYNVAKLPPPPVSPLRVQDFWVLPAFGERSLVVDLKDLPRYGLDAGRKVVWGYNLSRPGKYRLRVGIRSVPVQLVPEVLRGDPSADQWEGSTLSNVVEMVVRRR